MFNKTLTRPETGKLNTQKGREAKASLHLPTTLLSILSQTFQVRETSAHCDSVLSWHASCISRHKRSGARWRLDATRVSSQSSRKREAISPDQFCPVTSGCVRTPPKKMYTRFLSSHRRRCSNQDCLGRHTSTCLLEQKKVTDRQKGLDDHQFFLENEEEELAVRPILSRDIPDTEESTSLPSKALPTFSAGSLHKQH